MKARLLSGNLVRKFVLAHFEGEETLFIFYGGYEHYKMVRQIADSEDAQDCLNVLIGAGQIREDGGVYAAAFDSETCRYEFGTDCRLKPEAAKAKIEEMASYLNSQEFAAMLATAEDILGA